MHRCLLCNRRVLVVVLARGLARVKRGLSCDCACPPSYGRFTPPPSVYGTYIKLSLTYVAISEIVAVTLSLTYGASRPPHTSAYGALHTSPYVEIITFAILADDTDVLAGILCFLASASFSGVYFSHIPQCPISAIDPIGCKAFSSYERLRQSRRHR